MNTSTSRHTALTRQYGGAAVATILLIAALALPTADANPARLLSYNELVVLIIVAVALNIAMGFAGQLILGIPAVFAVGGYASSLLVRESPMAGGLVAMLCVGAVSGLALGMILGLPALRVGEFYLALVSIYAALAIPAMVQRYESLGGETGFLLFVEENFEPGVSGSDAYYVSVLILAASVVLSWAILRSSLGRRFAVLRSSHELTRSLGYSVYRQKLAAIGIASALAGVAGGLYAYTQQFIGPTTSSAHLAILLLAAVSIGGAGSVLGPVIGGALILGLNKFITGLENYNDAVFGTLLLLFAVFLPRGLVNAVSNALRQGSGEAVDGLLRGDGVPRKDDNGSVPGTMEAGDSTSVALSVVRASRSFGAVKAVDNIDLELRAGQVHGLIGSNGSGKTTLLNLICGFYRVDAGEISMFGRRIDGMAADRIARKGLARTFQTPKLIADASVLDNILVAVDRCAEVTTVESILRLPRARRTRRVAEERVRTILENMGIAHVVDQDAGDLSHGTQRLVEMARVVAAAPAVVLADEPAAGLTATELEALRSALRELADQGAAVLVIEHNVPFVLDLATRVTAMHQGSTLFAGTPEELRDNRRVADAFLGGHDSIAEEVDA